MHHLCLCVHQVQYPQSKACRMSRGHDFPPVSGSIIWAKQVSSSLKLCFWSGTVYLLGFWILRFVSSSISGDNGLSRRRRNNIVREGKCIIFWCMTTVHYCHVRALEFYQGSCFKRFISSRAIRSVAQEFWGWSHERLDIVHYFKTVERGENISAICWCP